MYNVLPHFSLNNFPAVLPSNFPHQSHSESNWTGCPVWWPPLWGNLARLGSVYRLGNMTSVLTHLQFPLRNAFPNNWHSTVILWSSLAWEHQAGTLFNGKWKRWLLNAYFPVPFQGLLFGIERCKWMLKVAGLSTWSVGFGMDLKPYWQGYTVLRGYWLWFIALVTY